MSYISGSGTLLTSAEVAVIVSLTNLVVSPAGQAINKTGITDFGNTPATSGTWYQNEVVTLAGDSATFTLMHAPTSLIFLLGGHQPQIYGVDFTGTINGVNRTFAYTSSQAPVATDQYATYI